MSNSILLVSCAECHPSSSFTAQRVSKLQCRHNGLNRISNHQPHHCLLSRLFGCRSKKTSKLRVTGLCAENSPGTGEFSAQRASNTENVSIWWCHHECNTLLWYFLSLPWLISSWKIWLKFQMIYFQSNFEVYFMKSPSCDFHWTSLMINHHWCRLWLGATKQDITWTNLDWSMMPYCVTRPQWVYRLNDISVSEIQSYSRCGRDSSNQSPPFASVYNNTSNPNEFPFQCNSYI